LLVLLTLWLELRGVTAPSQLETTLYQKSYTKSYTECA